MISSRLFLSKLKHYELSFFFINQQNLWGNVSFEEIKCKQTEIFILMHVHSFY